MYVVLSRAGKHVPYGKFVSTTERITLYPRCHTDRGRYNRVQLYLRCSKQSHYNDEKVDIG